MVKTLQIAQERSIGERLLTWVQVLAFLGASWWAVRRACIEHSERARANSPTGISLDLSLKRLGRVRVPSASNPPGEPAVLRDGCSDSVRMAHSGVDRCAIVATGGLLDDTYVSPGETVTRSVVFYVHQYYDVLHVSVVAMTTTDSLTTHDLAVGRSFDSVGGVIPQPRHVGSGGDSVEVVFNEDGSYAHGDRRTVIMTALTRGQVSLLERQELLLPRQKMF
jgi:hypothetical protein